MRYMMTYDMMETWRTANQWLGATALACGSFPVTGLVPTPLFPMIRAWGEVTERSFRAHGRQARLGHRHHRRRRRPRQGRLDPRPRFSGPFGDLVRFRVSGRDEKPRRILLVAPMSGHYATLLRSTVASLLPDAEVWITDWHNARDIPVSEGKFDVEDYTLYLADFIRHLGPDTHVIAVCQPAPLALAATALSRRARTRRRSRDADADRRPDRPRRGAPPT